MAAKLLYFEMSLTNSNMAEEGYTLTNTLLPYLNRCFDYSFLAPKMNFILNIFLNSLALHIKDTRLEVGTGFALFGIKINPTLV